jgi:hypothetical protein
VFAPKALLPNALLFVAVVFCRNASLPTALLAFPVVFAPKAKLPTAVFVEPVVLAASADAPSAALLEMFPAPRPTLLPLIVESADVVIVVKPVIKQEPSGLIVNNLLSNVVEVVEDLIFIVKDEY